MEGYKVFLGFSGEQGMFVALTPYVGSCGRLDFETFFTRQILKILTDRPEIVCKKPFRF